MLKKLRYLSAKLFRDNIPLFLCLTTLFLGIFITIGRCISIYQESSKNYEESRNIRIDIKECSGDLKYKLVNFLSDSKIERLVITNNENDIIGYYEAHHFLSIPYGSQLQETTGEKNVWLSDFFLRNHPEYVSPNMLDMQLMIFGEEYHVAGRYHGALNSVDFYSSEVLIPLKWYSESEIEINSINLVLNERVKGSFYDKIEEIFKDEIVSGNMKYQKASLLEISALLDMLRENGAQLLFLLLAIGMVGIVFKLFISFRAEQIRAIYFCGASYREISFLYFCSLTFFTFPALIQAFVIYCLWIHTLSGYSYSISLLNEKGILGIFVLGIAILIYLDFIVSGCVKKMIYTRLEF